MTHDETRTPHDGPTLPRAIAKFERTFRQLYVHPDRALVRFWEAVDSHGLMPAATELWDDPRSFGLVRRRSHDDLHDLVLTTCEQAEEAFLFRGLRAPPARMKGPLDAMKEREAAARRQVWRVVTRLYRDPNSALRALEAIALDHGPKEAAAALAAHELGAARDPGSVVAEGDVRAVRRWARKHAIVADPEAHVAKERQLFRIALSDHLLGQDDEDAWRETVRSSGTFRAAHDLFTRASARRRTTSPVPAGTPSRPQALRLELRTRALLQAEAVAHSAGFRSELHLARPHAVTSVAISLSDSTRRSEGAERREATYERISHLRDLGGSWERAKGQIDTARAECANHLIPVVQDPAWVVDRLVAAHPDDQARMLSALRTTPELAEREIGARAALVKDRGWWPFRRTPSTSEAQQRAPMAAAWLAHLAASTRAEESARRALAVDLECRPDDSPEQLRSRLAATLSELTTRGADYDALVRSLADTTPAHTVIRGIDHWPPHLKLAVEQVTGTRVGSPAGAGTTAREPALGVSM